MATAVPQYVPISDGTDDLSSILGQVRSAASQIGDAYHKITNDLAALEAQNNDISQSRWTLNNAVYQYNALSPMGQLVVGAALLYILTEAFRG